MTNEHERTLQKIAEAAVDALLTSWQGEVGDRLAIKKRKPDSRDEFDFGGRARGPAIDAVFDAIRPLVPPNVGGNPRERSAAK